MHINRLSNCFGKYHMEVMFPLRFVTGFPPPACDRTPTVADRAYETLREARR
jgi:hypothetical protein